MKYKNITHRICIFIILQILLFSSCGSIKNNGSDEFSYYKKRGLEEFNSKNYTECISYLENAIDLNPSSSSSYSYLGIAYYRLGNYTKAIEIFDKLISLPLNNEDAAIAYINRGEIKREKGDLEGANMDIQHALKLDNTDGYLYATLAMIHADKGELELFYTYIEKAINCSAPYPLKEKYNEKKTLQKFQNHDRFLKILAASKE